MAGVIRSATLGLVAVVTAACAGTMGNREFGQQGFAHQRFTDLDSAMAPHVGRSVVVRAQHEMGQERPVNVRPNVVSFRGRIAGLDEGWLHLVNDDGDSARVGKGNIVGVWLDQGTRGPWAGVLVGAVSAGAIAFGALHLRDDIDRPGAGVQVAIVGGAAAVGGLFGGLVWGRERRGEQLYPVRVPQQERTR